MLVLILYGNVKCLRVTMAQAAKSEENKKPPSLSPTAVGGRFSSHAKSRRCAAPEMVWTRGVSAFWGAFLGGPSKHTSFEAQTSQNYSKSIQYGL